MTYRLFIAWGALLVSAISLTGQELPPGSRLQVANWLTGDIGVRALDEGFNNQVVKGKPFSATEERHSLQILGNGTRIETSQSNRLYRDSEGRTRVEDMGGKIAIWDPVAGFRAELDPATKVARKGNAISTPYGLAVTASLQGLVTQLNQVRSITGEVTENLKPQAINGIAAQGTRVTTTIPRGQIGNDRDIAVITERWVSNDLQMLVKSLNSDPRFGDTTYELTRIAQGPQDASLFQIPSDYTQTGNAPGGRGGGRGPAPGGRGGGRSGAPPPPGQRLLPGPSTN
jgi:hypothetical protein